jgi:nucleoside-diphosphate-sugar epimerase
VYDLAVEKDTAFTVNLEGTKNVNDFVRSIKNLHRYNYVSTCYVAGKRKGRILETELEHDAGFRNFYEETKFLAEMEVERLKKDLPVTIFRPVRGGRRFKDRENGKIRRDILPDPLFATRAATPSIDKRWKHEGSPESGAGGLCC